MREWGSRFLEWLGGHSHSLPGEFYISVLAENLNDGRQSTLVVGIRTESLEVPRDFSRERARIRSQVLALQVAGEYYRRLDRPVLVRLRFRESDEIRRPAQPPHFSFLSGHEVWMA